MCCLYKIKKVNQFYTITVDPPPTSVVGHYVADNTSFVNTNNIIKIIDKLQNL